MCVVHVSIAQMEGVAPSSLTTGHIAGGSPSVLSMEGWRVHSWEESAKIIMGFDDYEGLALLVAEHLEEGASHHRLADTQSLL